MFSWKLIEIVGSTCWDIFEISNIVLQFSLVSFAGTSILLCLQAPGGATITPEAMAQLQAKMGWDDSPKQAFRKMIIHSRELTWRAPKIYPAKDVGEGCFGDVPIFVRRCFGKDNSL